MRRRHELTDGQVEKVETLLPGRDGDPGRTATDNRMFVNAVLFVARTGIPWRDLPERFGRWCVSGVWAQLAEALGWPSCTWIPRRSRRSTRRRGRGGGLRKKRGRRHASLPRSLAGRVDEQAPRGRERRAPRRAANTLPWVE